MRREFLSGHRSDYVNSLKCIPVLYSTFVFTWYSSEHEVNVKRFHEGSLRCFFNEENRGLYKYKNTCRMFLYSDFTLLE